MIFATAVQRGSKGSTCKATGCCRAQSDSQDDRFWHVAAGIAERWKGVLAVGFFCCWHLPLAFAAGSAAAAGHGGLTTGIFVAWVLHYLIAFSQWFFPAGRPSSLQAFSLF